MRERKRDTERERERETVCVCVQATLANFQSPSHFKAQIELLFWLWDVDDNGTLSYDEMVKGMVKLGYDPTIEMSHDDWDLFTQVNPQP